MKRFRVSIAGLMGVVIYVAIAVTALKYSTPLWAYIIFEMTIGLFCLSVLGAAFSSGNKRRFWAGFTVFGCANFLGAINYSGLILAGIIEKSVVISNMVKLLVMNTGDSESFYMILYCVLSTTLAFAGAVLSRILFRVDAVPAED